MRQNKKILMILLCGMLVLFCGCANKSTTYTYDNPKEASGFTLNKAVYSEGKLKLYSLDFSGEYDLICYDNQFQCIEEAFETSYKDGVYTITGENAEKISGIVLQNNSVRFFIRYLNTNQYAAICYYEATDVGWMTEDDGEKYYTEEEKQKQKEAKEEREKIQKQNFETLLGQWVLIGDEKTIINFYYDSEDNQKCAWTRMDGEGEYRTDEINVDQIDMIEHEREIMLSIMEGVDWGCCYSFSISEDMSMIKEKTVDWNDFYVRKDSDAINWDFTMLKMEMLYAGVFVDDKQVETCLELLKQAGAKQFVSAKWSARDGQYVINVLTADQTIYGVFLTDECEIVKAEEIPEQY